MDDDFFTPATSEVMVFTRSAKRFFDLDAVRTEPLAGWRPRTATAGTKGPVTDRNDRGIGVATRMGLGVKDLPSLRAAE